MNRLNKVTMGLIFTMFLPSHTGHAYEVRTHAAISERAAQESSLPQILQNQLALPRGLDHIVDGKSIVEWVRIGSRREDDFFFSLRFRNHFHDPLAPRWRGAGLFHFFESSLLWAQDVGSVFTNDWAWPEAREYFYQGLTLSDPTKRGEALGNTFRALGQVIHLVQDAVGRQERI